MILHVKAVEARDLPKMDAIGKSDPFLTFQLNQTSEKQKTKYIKQTLDPVWNEDFHFPLTPNSDNILHVEVFDMDKVSDDDLISNRDFDIKSFKPGEVYDDWYDFFPGPKAKTAGKVHLIFHVASFEETPFVPRPPEEPVVQEKEIKVEQEPEEEQEPEQQPEPEPEQQEPEPEPEQKEPEPEQQPEPEPEQQQPEPEPESKQTEEDNQPQILNEIDTNNVQTREINPVLEQPQQNQQQEEKPAQQEEIKIATQEAAPIEKVQARTRSTLQTNQAKSYNQDLDELPFSESKCKMILIVIILVELFILFLMKKF